MVPRHRPAGRRCDARRDTRDLRRSLGALALALIMKLYIARHAETTWNLAGRYQGRRESALSARGIQQGFALAEAFAHADPAPVRIIASPMQRTRATATFVAERLNVPLETDDALIEIAHGTWEGRLRDEIAANDPARYTTWRERRPKSRSKKANPSPTSPPAGNVSASNCTSKRRHCSSRTTQSFAPPYSTSPVARSATSGTSKSKTPPTRSSKSTAPTGPSSKNPSTPTSPETEPETATQAL